MASKHTVCVVLTPELIERVNETARSETIPVSAVVRQALKSYFFALDVSNRHGLSSVNTRSEKAIA